MSDVITPAPSSESISQSVLLAQVTGEELFLIASDGRSFTTAKEYFPASNPNATTGPTLTGPVSFYLNQTQTWKITNYDFPSTYDVSVSAGTVTVNQDTLTITAPLTAGPFNLIVNGQTYALTAINPVIQTPSITNPTQAQTNVGESLTIALSAFAMQAGTDTYHSTNWQLATDAAFTNIVTQSLNDTANIATWTVSNLTENTTYYVRAQYQGTYGETSPYSNSVSFTTKTQFLASQIVSYLSSGAPNSYFGQSVSLNAQGNIALIGASGENSSTGAAYIYSTTDGVTWTQVARLSSGVTVSRFGSAVSLNAQGTVALVGAYYENNSLGAAYIYSTTDGVTWTQVVHLTGNNAYNASFGQSVALNAQGNVALIGASGENSNTGAAYIYSTTDGVTWTQVARLSSNISFSQFSNSVVLNAQGNVALIGASGENSTTGAAYIYSTTNGTTWTQVARLSSNATSSYFGQSVSLNTQGTVAIIGAYYENNGTGAAYVYSTTDGVTWTQAARLSSNISGSYFGASVSLNDQGNAAIIGAYAENNATGAAYIYSTADGVTWTQASILNNGSSNSYFGVSVSISDLGRVALIGASNQNYNTGAAYIAN